MRPTPRWRLGARTRCDHRVRGAPTGKVDVVDSGLAKLAYQVHELDASGAARHSCYEAFVGSLGACIVVAIGAGKRLKMPSVAIDNLLARFFAKMELRDALSAEEKAVIRDAVVRVETLQSGEALVIENKPQTYSRILLDGLAARSQMLSDGRRQITELHVGGDFVDLHSFLLKRLEHDVIALTPVKVAAVPHTCLRDISEKHPHLTRLLWLSTLVDAAIHRQWLVSSGRRSAVQQLAHLVCELLTRMKSVGLCDGSAFHLPLTQSQLGDVCGLSTVHINRVAQELRGTGLIEWKRSGVKIRDRDGLAAFAQFDPTYLAMRCEPR